MTDLRQTIEAARLRLAEWERRFSGAPELRETLGLVEDLDAALARLQATGEAHAENEEPSNLGVERTDSHQAYRELFELAPDGYLVTDPHGEIRDANRAAAEMLSSPADSLIGKSLIAFVSDEGREGFRRLLSGLRGETGIREIECHMQTGEQTRFEAVIRVSAIRRGSADVAGFRWNLRDVTARKRTRNALRRERDFISTVLDTVQALVVVLDTEGRVLRCNRACEEVTSYSADELKGGMVWELLVPEEQDAVRAVFNELSEGLPNSYENCWVTRDGSRRRIAWHNSCVRDEDGRVRWIVGTGIDVTEHREAERLIQQGREELQSLAARLLTAEEEERRRLARELHDDLNQRVAALAFEAARGAADPALQKDLRERFRSLSVGISSLADAVRNMSRELHPSRVEDLGLAAALGAYCEEVSERHALAVSFRRRGPVSSIPRKIGSCLYRIAKESLTNVARHSGSPRVAVRLFVDSKWVGLSVRDFGTGFDPSRMRDGKRGLGIISMEERARLVGGELRLRTAPGRGTVIRVRAPLRSEDGEEASSFTGG